MTRIDFETLAILSRRHLTLYRRERTEAAERAAELVAARCPEPGGAWYVELRGVGEPPLLLAPHMNPTLVKEEALSVRGWVAALLRQEQPYNWQPA